MRILEDEGKIMALSDFSYMTEQDKNPMLGFFKVDGMNIRSMYSPEKRYSIMKNIFWNTSLENFSYMAQSALENFASQFFTNSIEETGIKDVVWAGGIASNIKMNMKLRKLENIGSWYVFPDMGDSGLSGGAALLVSSELYGTKPYKLQDMYLGPEYGPENIIAELKKHSDRLKFEERDDFSEYAGDLVAQDNIVFWHQGMMEAGPRALGNRSILASSSSLETKDRLNMQIKRRSWYQPFCPSILSEDANKFVLENKKDYSRFMTMGYMLRDGIEEEAKAVMNVDKSIRPQILENENPSYRKLIETVRKDSGYGIILNTSFNIHGLPIVNTPQDAIETQLQTKNKHMFIGNFHVELR
jgi:carbamoyltransferase